MRMHRNIGHRFSDRVLSEQVNLAFIALTRVAYG